MTAPGTNHPESDNSVQPLGSNPDAQYIIDTLQRCDGATTRQRLLFASQLPEGVLDDLLVQLEAAGVVTIHPGYSGDRIELRAHVDGSDQA